MEKIKNQKYLIGVHIKKKQHNMSFFWYQNDQDIKNWQLLFINLYEYTFKYYDNQEYFIPIQKAPIMQHSNTFAEKIALLV